MTEPSPDTAVVPESSRARRWWLDGLHLVALSALAIAWPVLDLLSKNSTFFAAHEMTGGTIVLYALGLIVVPPLVGIALVRALRLISVRAAWWTQIALVGLLGSLIVATPLTRRVVGGIDILLYPLVAVLLAVAYGRLDGVRRFVTIITPVPIVFLVLFLTNPSVRAFFSNPSAEAASDVTGKPVVMLLLDEMTLPSILDGDGKIDGERFPSFARLAERSTWYRNATTNANQTHHAVPAILTGDYPRPGDVPPIQSRYPNNLFTLLSGRYEIHADEWVTRLCPPSACRQRLVPFGAVKHIAADTALISLRLWAPSVIVGRLPALGDQWGGFFADPIAAESRIQALPGLVRRVAAPLLRWVAIDDRRSIEVQRLEAFTRSIRRSSDPTFWFLHVGLPHVPWNLLPDTRRYDHDAETATVGTGAYLSNEGADEALQRYLVQVQATDEMLGELMDRLDEQQMWDDTLFVVQADHGVVFDIAKRPRELEGAEDEILPIPMFIHTPGQRRGRVDDGVAELIDVTPTIADALGARLPWRVDGTSLLDEDRPKRARRVWAFGEEVERFDRSDPSFTEFERRIRELFGDRRKTDDLFAWGPHRDLAGRRLDRLEVVGTVDLDVRIDRPERFLDVDADGPSLPVRVSGSFRKSLRWTWYAVAVNGRVAGLGRPYLTRLPVGVYAILTSPRYFTDGRNDVELLGISADGAITRLR